MFRNRDGFFANSLAGIDIMLYTPDDKAIKMSDIQEGDIVVLTGRQASSLFISIFSRGTSHVGLILKINDKLWFVESVNKISNPHAVIFSDTGCCPKRSGVAASALPSIVPAYKKSAIYRPTPRLNEHELCIMRREFMAMYKHDYEHNWLRLANSALTIPSQKSKKQRFYCSQLVAHLFKKAGRLRKEFSSLRYNTGDYKPSDIPLAINCTYKGYLPGTKPYSYEHHESTKLA